MSDSTDDTMGSDDVYELDELLGAYALDAVDDFDRDRVEDYLRINPRAAAEVQEHREVASMLAFTGMSAPEGVWSRIMDQIDAEAPDPGPELAKIFAFPPAPSSGSVTATIAVPQRTDRTQQRAPRSSWLLGAAAAIVLVVAGVAVVGARSSTVDDPIDVAYATAASAPDSLSAELVSESSSFRAAGVVDAGGQGFVDGADLPRLDADMTYQLWGVLSSTGDVVSIGILGDEPGLETFTVDGDVSALAITIERAPGVVSDGNPVGAYVGDLV
jgi:anti-sigma factor RsiW